MTRSTRRPDQPPTARDSHCCDGTDRQIGVRTAQSGLLEIVAVGIDASQSTVQVHGELDLASADTLTAALEHELTVGHRFVRLDLSRLTFTDCAGLRALVAAHNRFLAARGTMVLTGLRPQVTRLLAITHLDDALFVADGAARRDRARHLGVIPTPQ
jgi:anti-anti-sigma factor